MGGRQDVDRFQARGKGRPVLVAVATLLWLGLAGCSGITVHQRSVLERVDSRSIPFDGSGVFNRSADDLIHEGLSLDRSDPCGAIACYSQAALIALPGVLASGVSTDPQVSPTGAQGTYNRAVEYAVLTAQRVAHNEGLLWTEVLARQGIAVQGQVSAFAPGEWVEAMPARSYQVEGLRRMVARGGLGAPLVLSRTQPRDPNPDDRYFPSTVFKAATAVIRPSGASPGEPPIVLELHDPVREPDMLWTGRSNARVLPMACDMTTPLARQFTDRKLDLAGALGVLVPSKLDGKTGIYMLDPYEPGKIPVIFVHGLNSSPEAWTNAMNELRGDPELRKRYQFWLFFYSSGNPILLSASRLRTSLNEIREQFDPQGRDPAFRQSVVIGHSMGGLLSRLIVSSSGSTLWDNASRVPPEQIDLDPELKEKFVHALIFEPVPSVSRVVFIATPHGGSPLGNEFVGRLVSSLITLPHMVKEVSHALTKANGVLSISPAFRDRRQMTGVAQLSENNPVLPVIDSLPINPNVTYHSIIGFDGKGTCDLGGDGVVPYTSAHLEGALSERVVPSNHSVQETDKAVIEMRRILWVHLREYDAVRRARALGQPIPAFPTRPNGPTPVVYDLNPPPTDTTRPARGGEFSLRNLRLVR